MLCRNQNIADVHMVLQSCEIQFFDEKKKEKPSVSHNKE